MQKVDLLLALLEQVNYESVIVFCRTKHGADRVAQVLKRNNHAVAVLHSNRTQKEREQALRGFRDGRFEVLVATDIASRGLDIADVSHVINYDVPQHPEDYIHRIGRTGRAEAKGDAFTLMVAEDSKHVIAIERFISQKIPRVKLENSTTATRRCLKKTNPAANRALLRWGARSAGAWRLSLCSGTTETVGQTRRNAEFIPRRRTHRNVMRNNSTLPNPAAPTSSGQTWRSRGCSREILHSRYVRLDTCGRNLR